MKMLLKGLLFKTKIEVRLSTESAAGEEGGLRKEEKLEDLS